MPKQETVLSLFLASPSDVTEEREAAVRAVDEVNRSQRIGVRIEVVRWETHSRPGIGQDAQDVINQQLAADYDIFLAVMWARVGTPTGRASSGTIEEYERALAKWLKAPSALEMFVYFKDAPLAVSAIDPDQLAQVNAFKARVKGDGVLYRSFNDTADFEARLRLHLSQFVHAWHERGGVQVPATAKKAIDSPALVPSPAAGSGALVLYDDEDAGFYDLVETATDHLAHLLAVGERLGEAAQSLGGSITERTSQIDRMKAQGKEPDLRTLKRISNLAAEDMRKFVTSVRAEIPSFATHSESALRSTARALTLFSEDGAPTDADERRKQVVEMSSVPRTLADSLRGSRESLVGFSRTIAAMPRVTTEANRARKLTVAAIQDLISEWDRAITVADEIEQSMLALASDSGSARAS